MKTEVALQILLALIGQAGTLSAAITKARAEGRDDLTTEELQAFRDRDDEISAKLDQAIAQG